MKIWNDITTTALMGTERTPVKPIVDGGDPLTAALAQVSGKADTETALLDAAGILTTYRRAGLKPSAAGIELPAPSDIDTLPECGPRAAHLLAIIFSDGAYREIAGEALILVAQANRRIPPAGLPALLELGRQSTALRADIGKVIGRRGAWLAAQNPDWAYAAFTATVEVDVNAYSTAPRAARVGMLQAVAATSPADARTLLMSTWAQESADDRAALLATMATGLSMADEEFLEATLDDRSLAVRSAASYFLARLPESRYVRRMTERASALISVHYIFPSGHALDVRLPPEMDAAMQRDAVEKSASAARQVTVDQGRKGAWLNEIVAAVPPTHWSTTFDRSPADIVALVEKSEWADLLLRALVDAVVRHYNEAWTLALLAAFLRRPSLQTNLGPLESALDKLPTAKFEAIIVEQLAKRPLAAPGPPRSLLSLHTTAWSPSLTQAVLGRIKQTLDDYSDHQTISSVSTLIWEMAMRVPPSMAVDVEAVVEGVADVNSYAARNIEKAIALLRLRQDLRDALAEIS